MKMSRFFQTNGGGGEKSGKQNMGETKKRGEKKKTKKNDLALAAKGSMTPPAEWRPWIRFHPSKRTGLEALVCKR